MPTFKRDIEKEFDELNRAVDVVCGYCIRPADFDGTGEPCNHCYVAETWSCYRKMLDDKED